MSCWRSVNSVATGVARASSANSWMSSPTCAAGQKPTTAFGVNHCSSMMRFEHRLRVVEQSARRRALLRVVEDGGIAALQLPGLEERRPVDVAREIGEIGPFERARPEVARRRGAIGAPVGFERIGARFGERHAELVGFAALVRLRDLAVFGAHRLDGRGAGLRREQRRDDADRAARVVDVHRLAAGIARDES